MDLTLTLFDSINLANSTRQMSIIKYVLFDNMYYIENYVKSLLITSDGNSKAN